MRYLRPIYTALTLIALAGSASAQLSSITSGTTPSVITTPDVTARLGDSTTSAFHIFNSSNFELLRIQTGKVVVGGDIQLSSGGNVYGDTTDQRLTLSSSSGAVLYGYSGNFIKVAGNVIDFSTNPGIVMRILDGNVGIGILNPLQKLSVGGNIQLSTGGYVYGDTTDTNLLISHSQGAKLSWNADNYLMVGGNITRIATNAGVVMSIQDYNTLIGRVTYPVQFKDMAFVDGSQGLDLDMPASSEINVAGLKIGKSGMPVIQTAGTNPLILNQTSGGIVQIGTSGTSGHTSDLTVNGTITGTTIYANYQDVAEWVPAAESMPSGTVVVLSDEIANTVTSSTRPYDTGVAGVVSPTPGLLLGVEGPSKAKIATTGRVKVRVDATKVPIRIGDLLVTSDHPGLAMKSEPLDLGGAKLHRPGTLIGKALEPLPNGEGEILVLLSLQ
jgi:hypothetical protein